MWYGAGGCGFESNLGLGFPLRYLGQAPLQQPCDPVSAGEVAIAQSINGERSCVVHLVYLFECISLPLCWFPLSNLINSLHTATEQNATCCRLQMTITSLSAAATLVRDADSTYSLSNQLLDQCALQSLSPVINVMSINLPPECAALQIED